MTYTLTQNYDETNAVWRLELAGEIDISNAQLLKAELDFAYEKHAENMIINAKELAYIDSTGLGVIISLYGKLKDAHKTLTLENPKDNVRKLLKVTQFDKILC